MKTAISIPDSIFRDAEALAERLGISRSALYTAAVAEYVARRTGEDVTTQLDRVYGVAQRTGASVRVSEQPPLSRADHW